MSQFTVNSSGAPYDPQTINITAAMANRIPWHFTSHEGYPAVSDRKTYDIGNLYVFCLGAGGASVGRLYMDYTFEFTNPTIESAPVTEVSILPTSSASDDSPYSGTTTPTITAVRGTALLSDEGAKTMASYVDSTGATHNTVGARVYKILKDVHALIDWAGSAGPYENAGHTPLFEPLWPVTSTSSTGAFVRVPNLDDSWNASYASAAASSAQGITQGGAVMTDLRRNEYLAFPQRKVAGSYQTNSNGLNPFVIRLSTVGTAGMAASALGMAKAIASLSTMMVASQAPSVTGSSPVIAKKDPTEGAEAASDHAPIVWGSALTSELHSLGTRIKLIQDTLAENARSWTLPEPVTLNGVGGTKGDQ